MTTPLQERHTRRVLGIHYCPVCKQDTMPEAKTGICFFCDTLIAPPLREAGAYRVQPLVCDHPKCSNKWEPKARGYNKRFCSEKCRKDWHWYYGAEPSRREAIGEADKERHRRDRQEYKDLSDWFGVRRDWLRWRYHLDELRKEAAAA